MSEFIREEKYGMTIVRIGDDIFLSRGKPKVIYTIQSNEDDDVLNEDDDVLNEDDDVLNEDNIALLENQIQISCQYNDFIDSLEAVSNYLFSMLEVNKIIIRRPNFCKELFLENGYVLEDDFIVKERPLEKNKQRS